MSCILLSLSPRAVLLGWRFASNAAPSICKSLQLYDSLHKVCATHSRHVVDNRAKRLVSPSESCEVHRGEWARGGQQASALAERCRVGDDVGIFVAGRPRIRELLSYRDKHWRLVGAPRCSGRRRPLCRLVNRLTQPQYSLPWIGRPPLPDLSVR